MLTIGTGDLTYEASLDWYQLPRDIALFEAIGVAVDSHDNLFVFNRGNPSIVVFDSDGKFLQGWGNNLIVRPHGIWIAEDDTIYLVDDIGHSVRQFTADGQLLRTIGPSGTASESGAEGFDFRTMKHGAPPFNLPTNLVTAGSGEMFVTDGYGNARVHRFSAEGELIQSWGEPGEGPGQFRVPHGIGIDRDERLYVADRENSRVQIFSTEGKLLNQWTDLVRPCQVYIGKDDLVYIAELGDYNGLFPWMERRDDAIGGRVSIFDMSGTLLSRWGGGYDSRQPHEFHAAHDICVDSRGDIYVGEVSLTAAEMAGEDPTGLPVLRKFVRRSATT
jgi:DNA-binding beta-propeller fold protein YncE